jgi:hypothetical protein
VIIKNTQGIPCITMLAVGLWNLEKYQFWGNWNYCVVYRRGEKDWKRVYCLEYPEIPKVFFTSRDAR